MYGKYECFVMPMVYVCVLYLVCILWEFSMLHSALLAVC